MGIEMRVPADAEQIIEKLNEHGFEAYVVGGCVRDSLLVKKAGGLGYHHLGEARGSKRPFSAGRSIRGSSTARLR